MSPRTTPPFRADHVGSLLRPPALLKAREDFKARDASTPTSCAGSRTRRSATSCASRRRSGCSRPPTASSAAPRGTWTSSTSSAGSPRRRTHQGPVPQRRGDDRVLAGGAARRGARRAARADLRRGLHVRAGRRDHGDAEADDPLAEHGPLPRRAGGGQRGRLPRHGRLLERPHERLRRRGQGAGRPRLHLPAVRRHEPRLPQRPQAARAHRRARAATPSTSTRPTSATSTRRSRAAPRA